MFTLLFTTTSKNLIVTGKTFPIKEQLKSLGGIWQSPAWHLPLNADAPLVRANLVESCRLALKAEKDETKAKLAYANSPEGRAAAVSAALKLKAITGAYSWICCESCVVLDWDRQLTTCQSCAADYGTHKESFFVRGRLRTGD